MDKFNLTVTTMYIAIILSGWIKNLKEMQGLDILYNEKLRYEHHYLNLQEIILWDATLFCLRIKKKAVITPKSINFL